jgi:hypothetical protein
MYVIDKEAIEHRLSESLDKIHLNNIRKEAYYGE